MTQEHGHQLIQSDHVPHPGDQETGGPSAWFHNIIKKYSEHIQLRNQALHIDFSLNIL